MQRNTNSQFLIKLEKAFGPILSSFHPKTWNKTFPKKIIWINFSLILGPKGFF